MSDSGVLIRRVRTPSNAVSSTPAPLDSAPMVVSVKLMTSKSLPIDKFTHFYDVALLFADDTIRW